MAYIRCLFDPQRSNSTSLLSPFSLSVLWHITVLPYLLWINTHIHSFRADAFTRSSSTLMFQIHTLVYQHPMFKCCDTLQVLLYLPLIDIFQSHSHVQLFATPWTIAHQASLSFTISWNLLKIMPIEQIMPTVNHFILCHTHPHLLTILPSINVFPNDLALCIRWPKYCNYSISPSNK